MKKIKNLSQSIILIGALATSCAFAQSEYIATPSVMGRTIFSTGGVQFEPLRYNFYIHGEPGADVNIVSSDGLVNDTITIPPRGMISYGIRSDDHPPLSDYATYNISSDADIAVMTGSGIATNITIGATTITNDLDYLPSIEEWGTEYRVTGFPTNEVPVNSPWAAKPQFIVITASEDNTTINIEPSPGMVADGALPQTITLNKGEKFEYDFYSIQSPIDPKTLAGTLVTADKPIAVKNVTAYSAGAGNIADASIYPTDYLDTKFVTLEGSNIYQVVAHTDNTEVTVNGTVVATLNAGEYYETNNMSMAGVVIETSEPAIVSHISARPVDGTFVAAGMQVLPGVNAWLASYQTMDGFTPTTGAGTVVMNITVETDAIDTLTFNDNLIDPTIFSQIAGSEYSSGTFTVDLAELSSSLGTIESNNGTPFHLSIKNTRSSTSASGDTILGATYARGLNPLPRNPSNPNGTAAIPSTSLLGLLLMVFSIGFYARKRGGLNRGK